MDFLLREKMSCHLGAGTREREGWRQEEEMSSSQRQVGSVLEDKEMKRKVYNQIVFETKPLCLQVCHRGKGNKGLISILLMWVLGFQSSKCKQKWSISSELKYVWWIWQLWVYKRQYGEQYHLHGWVTFRLQWHKE